jgi:ketosteroid isomerase-like protein
VARSTDDPIELVRRGYDAFNRGDFDAVTDLLDPDVVWQRVAEIEQPIRGAESVRAFLEPQVFSHQRNEIHAIEVVGECVLVDATFHGRGAASGIEANQRRFHLWRLRDGRVIELRFFLDRDEALAAARA